MTIEKQNELEMKVLILILAIVITVVLISVIVYLTQYIPEDLLDLPSDNSFLRKPFSGHRQAIQFRFLLISKD